MVMIDQVVPPVDVNPSTQRSRIWRARKRVQLNLDIPPAIALQKPVILLPLDIHPIPSMIPPPLDPPGYEDPAGLFSPALQQWPHREARVNGPSSIRLEI